MELSERKYILNTKELPAFAGGKVVTSGSGSVTTSTVGSGYTGPRADTTIPSGPGFFGSIGNFFGNAGKAIGSAAKSVGGFLEKDNSLFGSNAGAIGTGATGLIDMAGSLGANSKYEKTADDLLMEAGRSELNIGGVGYTVQNGLNNQQIEAEEHALNKANTVGMLAKGASTGAAIGSLAGPWGTAIGGAIGAVGGFLGGLLGSGKRHAAMRRAQKLAEIKRINLNDFSRSGALTTVLQNNLAETEGDLTQQTLYAAANGKESYSAGGPTSGYNARVSNGEIIANKFTGEMFRVPGLPNNKDGKLAFIRPSDTIISNKYGLSDYVALTGDLEGGEAMQGTIMKALGKRGYKNGKLPGFKWGLPEWTNLGVNAIGALTSAADASSIANEAISRPNTYSGNWLSNTALGTLKNLRANAYQTMPEIYDQMGKGMYTISNAGGLSGGQRTLSRLAGMQNTYDTTAKLLTDAQDRNAKYQAAYADAAANIGNEEARRMMNANQFDYEAYNQAHGARRLMASQRKADAMNYLNNWAKGLTDMHMWRQQLKLYQDDLDERRKDRYVRMGLNPDGTTPTKDPFVHTSPYNIKQNNGNPIYSSQDDKIAAAVNDALKDPVYGSVQQLVQKQLAKLQKKPLRDKKVSKLNVVSSTTNGTGGRILNPQALTAAVQRGAAIGRQETPYWSPDLIAGMLDYIRQNNFFLNR